jgi:2-dehydro-3-deoxygalactonokinase
LNGEDVVWARVDFDGHPVTLISGVRAERDVMRGEETELIGLMQLPEARHLKNRCVAILPGTHSKHAEIAEGKMISFRTLISGELFSVLSTHSVLRHSVRSGEQPIALGREAVGAARIAFVEGVREALQTDLMSALFHTRTRQLLQGQPEALNAAFLSGLLIGSEIGTLGRRKLSDDPIVLCAGSAVAGWYVAALEEAGMIQRVVQIPPEKVDQLSVFGHIALAKDGLNAKTPRTPS